MKPGGLNDFSKITQYIMQGNYFFPNCVLMYETTLFKATLFLSILDKS